MFQVNLQKDLTIEKIYWVQLSEIILILVIELSEKLKSS